MIPTVTIKWTCFSVNAWCWFQFLLCYVDQGQFENDGLRALRCVQQVSPVSLTFYSGLIQAYLRSLLSRTLIVLSQLPPNCHSPVQTWLLFINSNLINTRASRSYWIFFQFSWNLDSFLEFEQSLSRQIS